MQNKIDSLLLENKILKKELDITNSKLKSTTINFEKYKANDAKRIEEAVTKAVNQAISKVQNEYEKIITNLNNKIAKLEAKLNIDSSNSSLPSSKESIGKKTIPNLREKSDKNIGGQPGHKRHQLDSLKEEEITQTLDHKLDNCFKCGGNLLLKKIETADVIDFSIEVTKTRHNIYQYNCSCCDEIIISKSALNLPKKISYGNSINATALSLINNANVPYNKVVKHIYGITGGEINPSEGYLVKLQGRSAKALEGFVQELKKHIVTKLKVVHWDDTVIQIDKKQGIIRFYGDDKYALLIAHENKNKVGIDADGILSNLGSEVTAVHDHVLLNYNNEYKFKNCECNAHTLRYLKGVKENIHDHVWQDKLADLLNEINKDRAGKDCFSKEYISEVYKNYQSIIELGYKENQTLPEYHFYKENELLLIKRLDKYIDAHLLFIKDFKVPFTNNTAEKSFRISKTKMKVSGLFKNIQTANNYTNILTYIETCSRHGVNHHLALKRLLDGLPYTIKELTDLPS